MADMHLPGRGHAMLLYESDDDRAAAAIDCINGALGEGRICVYASVGALEPASRWRASSLASGIASYDENVASGNLVIVDFRPFFESAQKGDLGPFTRLKERLEGMMIMMLAGKNASGEKKKRGMTVFADAACTLSECREFDRCAQLESWWHRTCEEWARNGIDISVVCPHPGAILSREAHARDAISRAHSATLDFRVGVSGSRHQRAPRILIAEPEEDMQAVYRHYFGLQGAEATVVGSPGECLQRVFDAESPGFDAVVLDLHPRNPAAGLEVARKIRERLPGQRLVITTTAADAVEPERADVGRGDVLPKPFTFSELLARVTPSFSSSSLPARRAEQ